MRRDYLLALSFCIFILSCSTNEIDTNDTTNISDNSDDSVDGGNQNNNDGGEFPWLLPENSINGSFNPFPLALNPNLKAAKDVDFISDNSLVAMISFKNEIRVYPYQYLNRFESVNDNMDGVNFSMTYCPLTKSGLCWDRNYRNEKFVLRASGYLYNDNLIAFDSNSDTYWSQMLATCVKGKYSGQNNKTYNFVETTWATVKSHFANARVFTNTSVGNNSESSKDAISDGEGIYGIIDLEFVPDLNKGNHVYFYRYDYFQNMTKLISTNISNKNIVVIGNKDLHFITSFINDQNASFSAVQNQFPMIMQDSKNNKWNVFGIAVEGPRKGQQLESLTAFVASWSAWQLFYKDYIFVEK